MPTAPTMHCTPPFCIAPCSVNLVGSAVAEPVLEFGRDGEEECRKSLCTKPLRLAGNLP